MTQCAGMMVMMLALGFLLGFKIAAHISKQHLERMRAIWRGAHGERAPQEGT